jgi:serine/threonine protein phosphatase PrpC
MVQANFAGIQNMWLMGVCDGHGAHGHFVSDFVKTSVPRILEEFIRNSVSGKI